MPDLRARLPEELPHLRRYAVSLSRDTTLADDLVQDCIVTAIARAEQFRESMRLRPWLFTILRNTFLNRIRRTRQQPFADWEAVESHAPAVNGNQEARIELSELQAALDRLSKEHRDLILLVIVEGFSYEEAACALSVPIGTVRSRLARARVSLHRELGRDTTPIEREPRAGHGERGPLERVPAET